MENYGQHRRNADVTSSPDTVIYALFRRLRDALHPVPPSRPLPPRNRPPRTHLILILLLLLVFVLILVSNLSSLSHIQHRLQLDTRAGIGQTHVVVLLQWTAAAAAVAFRSTFSVESAERDALLEAVVDLSFEKGAAAAAP